MDSFEMAKGQLEPESEGEKKIDGSYQVRCADNLQRLLRCNRAAPMTLGRQCCAGYVPAHSRQAGGAG